MVVKKGTDFGIYVDGAQIAYTSDASTDSILGTLFFLQKGNSTFYTNGYLGEIYFGASNIFDASPDAGLTDTIVLKTKPFSWSGLNE